MVNSAILAFIGSLGLLLVFSALRPAQQGAWRSSRRTRASGDSTAATGRVLAIVGRAVESNSDLMRNLKVLRRPVSEHVADRLKFAALGALTVFGLTPILLLTGILGNFVILVGIILLGGLIGWFGAQRVTASQAEEARVEFRATLTPLLGLMASSASGGSSLDEAVRDSIEIGQGWVFDMLRQSVAAAENGGLRPWADFPALSAAIGVVEVADLGNALSSAASTGAAISQTMQDRADSARQREMSEERGQADKQAETLNVPLGVIFVAWVLFIFYPPISELLAGF